MKQTKTKTIPYAVAIRGIDAELYTAAKIAAIRKKSTIAEIVNQALKEYLGK